MTILQASASLDAKIHTQVFGTGINGSDIPAYSSDMKAAWFVVERLREIGLGIMLSDDPKGWEIEIITTDVLFQRGYHGLYDADVDVPLLICRAALRAVEGASHA